MGVSAAPTPILVEQRFPLDLDASDATIRAMYEEAKAARWDPFREFDWAALGASALPHDVREAARLGYSRRAWHEYTGLTETPAVLIRFCLEAGREADPKYFLTVRNTEEAWHIECFHAVARACGGDVPEPRSSAFAAVFNQRRHTCALDANASLDAYFVAHAAFEDELELALARASRANARHPVLAAMWERIVSDRVRHAAFGWAYVSRRAQRWTPEDRTRIVDAVRGLVAGPLFGGYQCASLAAPGLADDAVAAEATLAREGLGGVDAAAEQAALRATLAVARERLHRVGVDIPVFSHPRLGDF